ncbi:hypothetical protein Tco_0413016 [Tanacetum coccineum]
MMHLLWMIDKFGERAANHSKNNLWKAVLTLVERVKSLEVALKRKTNKVVVSEDEETENQGRKIQDIDDDPLVSLVRESMEEKAAELIRVSPGRVIISSGSAGVNTGSTPVSTPSIVQKVNVIISSPIKGQREGKVPMSTEDDEEATRQVHLDALLAKIISEEQELSEQQEKRKAEVQEAAQHYSEEDWDNIRAKLEANAELVKDVLGENVTSDDFAKRMNQGTWKPTQLKKLTFAELKEEFEKLVRSIESFVPKDSEIEKTRKRGKRKKQKVRKGIHADKTTQHEVEEDMEALVKANDTDSSSGTDIPISVVLVAIKPPSIVNWKIIKLGKNGVYQIIREDGTYITYIKFGAMLKSISRDDLTELYMVVMQRYRTNGPEDEYERVFWGDIKTMFDPPLSTDPVWNLPYQQKMLSWRYYDTCRVHCLNLESTDIYMLERRYPLPDDVCQAMLSKKLQGDKKDEACYQLLKLIEKQAHNKLP